MTHHDQPNDRPPLRGKFLTSRAGLVLIGFLAIVGALLFTEHRAHVLGILIWLPLLICPLMHFFMHGEHDAQSNQGKASEAHNDDQV
jgi:hypothetical protein